MENKYNFKCKKCGNVLTINGKCYGTTYRFFMCLGKNGCREGVWINIKTKMDNSGHKYE